MRRNEFDFVAAVLRAAWVMIDWSGEDPHDVRGRIEYAHGLIEETCGQECDWDEYPWGPSYVPRYDATGEPPWAWDKNVVEVYGR